MPSLDSLPGDQRAVLQLVLSRGRSYDEIARLLSINPAAVRERALAALDALGPDTRVSPESRRRIADYLLGQLSDQSEIEAVRDLLARSPSERAWTRVVASELAPLAPEGLPEIPTGTGGGAAEPQAASAPEPAAGAASPPSGPPPEPEAAQPAAAAAGRAFAPAAAEEASAGGSPPGDGPAGDEPAGSDSRRRSSRVGGAVLLALAVVAVAVVLFFVLRSNGNSPNHRAAATPPAGSTTSAGSASSTTTSATSSTPAKVVAQINLTPPHTGSKTAGIAEVLNEGASQGVAIVAQNVPPNSTKPPNAYAVWLYNSPSDAQILGFVNPGVGSNRRLSTAGALPSNARHYKKLIVTVETTAKPKSPGTVILQGPLTGI
ncbi:MAG TPA: sigma-70 region 4 domain-containing protein [Solirubrobacteraceae bacterium]|jgi:hypothetical protein|nr:sigma-70 region 4 domain-containing protein [Solirubrobacteraceae bacterium]